MHERALISVAGPRGAGKTAFIEAMLRSYQGVVNVGRCVVDGRVRQVRESYPEGHRELERYRRAGASMAALLRIPAVELDRDDTDFVYDTELMEDYVSLVVLECSDPLCLVDLGVYVARPVSGEPLLFRMRRGDSVERMAALDRLEQLTTDPGDLVEILRQALGERSAAALRQYPEATAAAGTNMLKQLKDRRQEPPPEPEEYWCINQHYQGIELAGLVIVNIENEGQREMADRLVSEVHRLRSDKQVANDVIGPLGTRHRITAVVANLADPRDTGLKKAAARAQRIAKVYTLDTRYASR